uniref:Uncharacterized protein n=1 Tax=Setaria italica TaxID=4555 RepID=K3YBS0_SETIT
MRVDYGIILAYPEHVSWMDACAHGPSHGVTTLAFEFPARPCARFSPMGDRSAREPVADGDRRVLRSDLQFYGGQDFQGETATFYTETGCAGTPYQVIGGFEGTQFCGDFGWRSINIDC